MPLCLCGATNDLTSALQRGLFEEEANHNLEAAAQAYQAVSARFDQDRKLAATAIFRLGEVYRKQGKTNEATAQYERIVREFSDQQTLATLSRQNLGGFGGAAQTRAADAANTATVDNLQSQYALLKAHLEQARKETNFLTIAKLLDDEDLRESVNNARRVVRTPEDQQKLFEAEAARALDYAEKRLSILQSAIQEARAGQPAQNASAEYGKRAPAAEDEEKEIRRIQAMIKNSPDLINAGAVPPIFPAVEAGYLKVVLFLLENGADVNIQSQGESPLHIAAKHGQKAMAELLLSRGANVNARNSSGNQASKDRTPLHEAAEAGFQAVAEALIANQADLNARDAEGHTPLHLAAERNRANLVVLLAPKMADINAEDSKGITPLGYAAAYGSVELVTALLDVKAEVNAGKRDVPLLAAINHSRPGLPVIELLLRQGANPDFAGVASQRGPAFGGRGYSTTTPLRAAIDRDEPEIVKLLLQFKADANAVDDAGRTALSRAVGNTNIVKLLLEAKADSNLGTADSPLLLAVRADNTGLAEMLLRAGANPNQETDCDILGRQFANPGIPTASFPGGRRGPITSPRFSTGQRGKRTPLQAAVLEEHPAMVKLLLQFKGDPKANDAEGFPLVLSALANAEMLKALLEAGADANAADGKGQAALIAARTGNAEAIDLLLKHGAKTEVRDEHGNTPLLAAIVNGSTNCVASLLAAGADVNAKSSSDWSALHGAVYYGRGAILQMLLAKGANPNVRDTSGRTPLDLVKPQSKVGIPPLPPGEAPRTSRLELADLLRQHGALDDLPDFTAIRVTRQGLERPFGVFRSDTNDWNRVTLLETVMSFYSRPGLFTGVPGQLLAEWLPFPDFGRIIIHRPDRTKVGKEQEIKVSLLNTSNVVDCARDVPLEFGDVIEIPERVHALNEPATNPLADLEGELRLHNLQRMIPTRSLRQSASTPAPPVEPGSADTNSARTRLACLLKTVQLVIQGQSTDIAVFAPIEGWLTNLLQRSEARSVLRSSSDLARVKVTRRDAATGQAREFIVDLSKNPPLPSDVWLYDGDVIEVPDKP